LHTDHVCSRLKSDAFRASPERLPEVVSETADRCGTPADRTTVVLILVGRGRSQLATDVARQMTRSSPDDYNGWLILGRLSGDRRALARAHELNPRGTPAP
jgi:hypothetical protein